MGHKKVLWLAARLVIAGFALWMLFITIAPRRLNPLAIDSFGLRTMQQLDYPELVVAPANNVTQLAASFTLPDNATQGPKSWYLLRLHFRLDLAEDTESGVAYVSASTNEQTAAQIAFEVYKVGDVPLVHWNMLDLIEGSRDYFTVSPSIEVLFHNYLRTAGVLPGTNTLSVKTETYGGVRLERLTVFDDTGIEYTPLAPPRLSMQVTLPEQQLIVGDILRLEFHLENRGDHPAKGVTVGVIYPKEAFGIRDQESWRFPVVEKEAQGEFVLEALQSGRHQIIVSTASDSGGQPATILAADIGLSRPDSQRQVKTDTSPWIMPISVGLGGLGLLLLTKNQWRRRSNRA
jgi:hypothetical protein